ncbi:MAG: hypothetical protein J5634_01980 [Bacilli bacterium]|nr:hypothetical protein [Bacilli bacterium]
MKEISFNSLIKVKLTDDGLLVLKNYYKVKYGAFYKAHGKILVPSADKDGYYTFSIYELMCIFGNDARMNYNLFASDILVNNFDVQDYDKRPPRKRRNH